MTSGKSPLSCWVRKKAAIVATTRTAKTARTRGRVIGGGTLENALRAGSPDRSFRRRAAVRPRARLRARQARGGRGARDLALRPRAAPRARGLRRDRVLLPARHARRRTGTAAEARAEGRR